MPGRRATETTCCWVPRCVKRGGLTCHQGVKLTCSSMVPCSCMAVERQCRESEGEQCERLLAHSYVFMLKLCGMQIIYEA